MAPPSPSAVYGRLAGAFAALAAGTAAVVVVVLLLHGLPPITATASTTATTSPVTTTTATPVATGFPAPPQGAVVLAARAGEDALGLAVTPGSGTVGLQASVVGYPKGISGGISGLAVRFQVKSRDGASVSADAVSCGAGCYRATAAVAKPAKVTVILSRHSQSHIPFVLPDSWPPPSAASTVARAATVWRRLRTLEFDDKLSTGGSLTLNTLWKIVAPDRISYAIRGASSSVIIGDRRWDKAAGGARWQESPQLPVQQPQPFWVRATDARLLGTVSVHGKPAWRISFFDPETPGWFTILVDKATMHTVDIRMTAIAHFMHDVYGPFNAPISINPPTP